MRSTLAVPCLDQTRREAILRIARGKCRLEDGAAFSPVTGVACWPIGVGRASAATSTEAASGVPNVSSGGFATDDRALSRHTAQMMLHVTGRTGPMRRANQSRVRVDASPSGVAIRCVAAGRHSGPLRDYRTSQYEKQRPSVRRGPPAPVPAGSLPNSRADRSNRRVPAREATDGLEEGVTQ